MYGPPPPIELAPVDRTHEPKDLRREPWLPLGSGRFIVESLLIGAIVILSTMAGCCLHSRFVNGPTPVHLLDR